MCVAMQDSSNRMTLARSCKNCITLYMRCIAGFNDQNDISTALHGAPSAPPRLIGAALSR